MLRSPDSAAGRVGIHDALRRSALFTSCADDVLDLVVDASRVRSLPRNALVLLEGDRPDSMFVVVDGLLRVFTTALDGSEPTLTVLLPGDHVGELGVLQSTTRSASVASLRPSTVIEVPGRTLTLASERDPSISRAMIDQLASRLRSTSTRLTDLTILDLGARVAKYLASEMVDSGSAATVPFVDLVFTQSELGQLLGGARQSINQELSTLERDGMIRVRRRRVEILDPAGLRRRATSS